MEVELVPTPEVPNNRSLAIRLVAKFYQLRMLLFGRSAHALKTLAMESSLNRGCLKRSHHHKHGSSHSLLHSLLMPIKGQLIKCEVLSSTDDVCKTFACVLVVKHHKYGVQILFNVWI